MKQLHEITDAFKMTKVRVPMTGELSSDFQKAMFTMGFRWNHERSGTKRNEMLTVHGSALHALFVDNNCRIFQTVNPAHFNLGGVSTQYREITPLELFEAAKEYKALDKKIRKAKKAEKKLSKEGWIIRDASDGVCPVAAGTKLTVIFAGKEFETTAPELLDWRWQYNGEGGDIIAYRLTEPVQATISLQDMITNIVADAGGVEVLADGWIVNTGTCPVEKGDLVDVRYRDGMEVFNVPALTFGTGKPEATDWTLDGICADIVAYRVVVEKADWELVDDAPVADTNPKKQYGLASIPLNLWSPLASAYGALGLYNGSLKYGTANFANTKVEASIYIAAAMRHLSAFAAGEEFDPADGVPNLGGVLANVAIILEARAAGTLIDDRAKMSGYLQERDALKAIVGQLQLVHAGKTPKHYTLGG